MLLLRSHSEQRRVGSHRDWPSPFTPSEFSLWKMSSFGDDGYNGSLGPQGLERIHAVFTTNISIEGSLIFL